MKRIIVDTDVVARRESADLVVVGRVGDSAGPDLRHIGSIAALSANHANFSMAVIGAR